MPSDNGTSVLDRAQEDASAIEAIEALTAPITRSDPERRSRIVEALRSKPEYGKAALDALDARRSWLTEPEPEVFEGIFDRVTTTFARFRVKGRFVGAVFGGTPKDRQIIEGWLSAKAGMRNEEAELAGMILRTMQEVGELPADDAEAMRYVKDVTGIVANEVTGNGFKKDGNGLFLEGRHAKAMLDGHLSA